MASTRAQQAQILRNQAVLDQLTGSLLAAAANVLNEASSTADHANRVLYANAVYVNPVAQATFLLPSLLTNATLSAEAGNAAGASGTPFADADVDYVVSSIYNVYADQHAAQQGMGAQLNLP